MKFLMGLMVGLGLATAYSVSADCCGAFNVPYDTQIEIGRQMDRARADERTFTYPAPASLTTPEWTQPCSR